MTEVVRYMDLEEFSRTVRTEQGTFAIVGAVRRDLEWAVGRLRDLGDVELVSMGSGLVCWTGGSLAHLVTDAEHLRGRLLDGALLVSGDVPISAHLRRMLETRWRGVAGRRWEVRW